MASSDCSLKDFLVRVGEISAEEALCVRDQAADIKLARKYSLPKYGEEPDRKVNIPIYTSGDIWNEKYK